MSDDSSPGSSDAHDETPFNTSVGDRPSGKYRAKKKTPTDYTPHYESIVERMTSAENANKNYVESKERKRLEKEVEKERRYAEKHQMMLDNLALRKEELARQQRADDLALLSCNFNELNPMHMMYKEKQLEEYHKRQGGM